MLASTIDVAEQGPSTHLASTLFRRFAAECESCEFSVRLWDGTELVTPASRFKLVVHHPRVLRNLFNSPNELTLGESFINGDIEVEGDFEAALRFANELISHKAHIGQRTLLGKLTSILHVTRVAMLGDGNGLTGVLHSRNRDRAAIARHYDVSNDFYRLWLDRNMVYSSAHFESPDEDLDTAQIRKLDYICRKLRLSAEDKVLDIGCGWGGLVIHAASLYGAHASGITVSVRQAEFAQESIRAAGLEKRCSVQVCDYRDVERSQSYNKIASIGMIEHVGRTMLKPYFRQAWRLLQPGGVFLVSGISDSKRPQKNRTSFIDRHVFPDGDLVPLHMTIREAELCGFEVRNVESLGEHYALTLDRWVERLVAHADKACQATDERIYRTWRLYMAASAHAFRTGRIGLYQILLSKRSECKLPLTRRDSFETRSFHGDDRLRKGQAA